jgi:hypothetical protein
MVETVTLLGELRWALPALIVVGLALGACAQILDINPNPSVDVPPSEMTPLSGVEGLTFLPLEAVVVQDTGALGGTAQHRVHVLASDQPGLCERANGTLTVVANERLLSVAVDGDAFAAGFYDLNDQPGAGRASFLDENAFCSDEAGPDPGGGKAAGSGSLQITSVNDQGVVGVMDVTFPSGRVRGEFIATPCPNVLHDDTFECSVP